MLAGTDGGSKTRRSGAPTQSWRGHGAVSSHRQLRLAPGMETADDIGRMIDPDRSQRRGGKGRSVPFLANHDPMDVVTARFRNPVAARRVQPPFEMVALDHDRAWNLTLCPPLELGPDVDEIRASTNCSVSPTRSEARQPRSRPHQQTMQRRAGCAWSAALRSLRHAPATCARPDPSVERSARLRCR
jgi:hypothetical protein